MLSLYGGAGFTGFTLEPRTFLARINIASFSRVGGWELAQRLAAWACTDEPCELVPTNTPGRAFTAILESASDLQLVRGFGVVEYRFAIPRPFYHSVAENVVTMPSGGRILAVGNVPARLSIAHRMAQNAPALTVCHDGAPFLRLRKPDGEDIPAGATLSIDMAKKLVRMNGETALDMVDYTATDWREPIRGATEITLSDKGQTEIRWRDEWM